MTATATAIDLLGLGSVNLSHSVSVQGVDMGQLVHGLQSVVRLLRARVAE